jgi:hypothetical protein
MNLRSAITTLAGLGLALLLVMAARVPAARSLPAKNQAGEPDDPASVQPMPGPEAPDVKQRGVALGLFA